MAMFQKGGLVLISEVVEGVVYCLFGDPDDFDHYQRLVVSAGMPMQELGHIKSKYRRRFLEAIAVTRLSGVAVFGFGLPTQLERGCQAYFRTYGVGFN